MGFEVGEKGPVLRHVAITVTGKALKAEEDRAYQSLSKTVKMKGFRQGHVPRSTIKGMYGKRVRIDAIDKLVNSELQGVVSELTELMHLSPWRMVEERTDDGGFAIEVDAEVRPAIEPTGYLGLEVPRRTVEVTDEEVEQEISRLQKQYTAIEPVEDRTVIEAGDLVAVDFHVPDNDELDRVRASEELMEAGGQHAYAGLSDGLVGKTLEQETSITVTLPEHFSAAPDHAGKEVTLAVTARAIKRRNVPELTDDFALDTGEAETIEELRKVIRERQEAARNGEADREAREALKRVLRERITFELPAQYVEARAQRRSESDVRMLTRGQADDAMLAQLVQVVLPQVRERVAAEVQDEIILKAIAERESIEVNAADLDARLETQAQSMGMPVGQLKRLYANPNMQSVLEAEVRDEKALDLLFAKASFVELVEPEEEEADEEAAGESEESTEPSEEGAE